MMKSIIAVALSFVSSVMLFSPALVEATTISYTFSGRITEVANPYPDGSWPYSGDKFTGLFSYDDNSQPISQGTNRATYNLLSLQAVFQTAGGYSEPVGNWYVTRQIDISNDTMQGSWNIPSTITPHDSISVFTQGGSNALSLIFLDYSGTILQNTSLPSTLPAFSNWDRVYLSWATDMRWQYLTGDIDSFTPVPEPATMLLLGSGLAGLIGFRRKFKR